MDEETRKAFDNVMLGICAIESMIASLMLNDAIEDGDEARIETIRDMTKKIEMATNHFADAIKRGEAE